MPRLRQLSYLPPPRLDHGGEVRKGKRKLARPIDPKRPLHMTLRASQARGNWSLLHRRHKNRVFVTIHAMAERYGIRVHRFQNVGNHLHLVVSTPSREAFQSFLRRVSGAIAMSVTGAKKGQALKKRFWDLLAWSRVVNWGREFRALETYLVKNGLESLGIRRGSYVLRPFPK